MTDTIVLEFNELCPSMMERFLAESRLPNFQRLYDSSVVCTTDAMEEPPNLEPWIQWVTIHSGMPADRHGIFDLGEGRSLKEKCIAELLSNAGVHVGVFGSMNTNYSSLNGYFIPDPWDSEGKASPDDLNRFYKVVSRQVQESSKEDGLSKGEMMQFGWFMLRHGMRLSTINSILRQLASERKDSGVKWRRAVILEMLQYDLFCKLKRRHNVQFSTFFCNSTAHFQHYFWRNMQPEVFEVPPGKDDHESLRDAIPFGYKMMDRLVGRFMTDFPDSRLVLLTALSQQPWTDTTKCTYRPRDFAELLEFAGADTTRVEVKPVMAEEFHVCCEGSDVCDATEQALSQLSLSGQPLMGLRREGNNLFCGCTINQLTDDAALVAHPHGGTRRFGDLFNQVHTMRSGLHHPDGICWIQNGRHEVLNGKVPLIDIAPTLLSQFGVAQPAYMPGKALAL